MERVIMVRMSVMHRHRYLRHLNHEQLYVCLEKKCAHILPVSQHLYCLVCTLSNLTKSLWVTLEAQQLLTLMAVIYFYYGLQIIIQSLGLLLSSKLLSHGHNQYHCYFDIFKLLA